MPLIDEQLLSRALRDILEQSKRVIRLPLTVRQAFPIIGTLQLYLRHPRHNEGRAADMVREAVASLINAISFTPAIREAAEAGYDPVQDLTPEARQRADADLRIFGHKEFELTLSLPHGFAMIGGMHLCIRIPEVHTLMLRYQGYEALDALEELCGVTPALVEFIARGRNPAFDTPVGAEA